MNCIDNLGGGTVITRQFSQIPTEASTIVNGSNTLTSFTLPNDGTYLVIARVDGYVSSEGRLQAAIIASYSGVLSANTLFDGNVTAGEYYGGNAIMAVEGGYTIQISLYWSGLTGQVASARYDYSIVRISND